MEKVESKEKMRNMKRGATIELPISSLETIRNNVSLLNAKHLLEGKKWASKSYPKKGSVVVKRESWSSNSHDYGTGIHRTHP